MAAELIGYGHDSLTPYRTLLQNFVGGRTSADELEQSYLERYKHDRTNWPDPVFEVLDAFFYFVDDYVADDGLRAEVNGIDAEQLRAKAELTLCRLAQVAPEVRRSEEA